MTTQPSLGELLLGIEGLALLRLAFTDAVSARRARLEDMRSLLQRVDDTPTMVARLNEAEYDLTEGYRHWSETYDGPGRRLIPIEEPIMHALLDPLPPSVVLDAACGTGRHSMYLGYPGPPYFDEQMILLCKAKGGKHRYVPILPELAQELRTHLRGRATGYLFETNRHAAFSPRRIQQLVKETADLAGITKRVTPHTLRHSVATMLLEHGMPLEQIQQFLGHAQLDTTQIYAASTTAMIKESYQQALSR